VACGLTGLARCAYRELLALSQLITDSPLDWTIARFTRPTNGTPPAPSAPATYLGKDHIRASITRADLATFLLACAWP
jgi:NAD(P)H-binding